MWSASVRLAAGAAPCFLLEEAADRCGRRRSNRTPQLQRFLIFAEALPLTARYPPRLSRVPAAVRHLWNRVQCRRGCSWRTSQPSHRVLSRTFLGEGQGIGVAGRDESPGGAGDVKSSGRLIRKTRNAAPW